MSVSNGSTILAGASLRIEERRTSCELAEAILRPLSDARRPPAPMSCQSLGTSHCQNRALSRGDTKALTCLEFGQGRKASKAWARGVPKLRTTKSGYSFKHRRRILCNEPIEKSTSCTVKEIPGSGLNFPPHDDFEQHCAPRPSRRLVELGLKVKSKRTILIGGKPTLAS